MLKKKEKKKCDICKDNIAAVVERTCWVGDPASNTKHYFCAPCKIMEMKKRGYL